MTCDACDASCVSCNGPTNNDCLSCVNFLKEG